MQDQKKYDNPCNLDGFAFLEFSGDKQKLVEQFTAMGFSPIAQHKKEDITLYQQGDIAFIVNTSQQNQPEEHAKVHGTGACAMGFKVKNARQAFDYALAHGAEAFEDCSHAHHGLLAIKAIGGSVIYFVDDQHKPFQQDWEMLSRPSKQDAGLNFIDHLTHNVYRGNMDKWAKFYEQIFNFREIRYFDIQGKLTGLISRALSSPCNKIRIPLNESKDDKSQIEEFLQDYKGEGIQHVALNCSNIYHTVRTLRKNGVRFLNVPDTYYEMLQDRVPWHQEDVASLQQEAILVDGDAPPAADLLLQIFTENLFGPVFFEIIQRKGNEGFGEGNFTALFEAIERDQIRRGTL